MKHLVLSYPNPRVLTARILPFHPEDWKCLPSKIPPSPQKDKNTGICLFSSEIASYSPSINPTTDKPHPGTQSPRQFLVLYSLDIQGKSLMERKKERNQNKPRKCYQKKQTISIFSGIRVDIT